MMRIFHQDDLPEVNAWYSRRGESGLTPTSIPETGLIEDGIAAGFLYRTDAPAICMLDAFVTNPEAPLRARAASVREIAVKLLELASAGGATHIMAMCKSGGIERLAGRLGLKPIGLYVVAGRAL